MATRVRDKNGTPLKQFDSVLIPGDDQTWIIRSIEGVDLDLQQKDGQTLTRMAQNVAKQDPQEPDVKKLHPW